MKILGRTGRIEGGIEEGEGREARVGRVKDSRLLSFDPHLPPQPAAAYKKLFFFFCFIFSFQQVSFVSQHQIPCENIFISEAVVSSVR